MSMRKSFLSILFAAFVLVANAQISNSWCTTISAADLPSSASRPTVAALSTTSPSKRFFTLYLDATTYDNATGSTAWAALAAAVKTEIDTNYVEAVFGLDPTADIVMRTVITDVRREWDGFDYRTLSAQYLADEDIFKVSGYCEWEVSAP
jgi:hypothetical protein